MRFADKTKTDPKQPDSPFVRTVTAEQHQPAVPANTLSLGIRNHALTPPADAEPSADLEQGDRLPRDTRAFFEPRFGHDFSQVRVHAGVEATTAAEAVKANAFTFGRDIFFTQGRYAPRTEPGIRLLAHELTHVVQQSRGGVSEYSRGFDASLESDADAAAEAIARGSAAQARAISSEDDPIVGGWRIPQLRSCICMVGARVGEEELHSSPPSSMARTWMRPEE